MKLHLDQLQHKKATYTLINVAAGQANLGSFMHDKTTSYKIIVELSKFIKCTGY